jgi:hypothetical protein
MVSSEVAPREADLLPMVIQQFSNLQQQMFDQFHQTMTMLVQMFSAAHRDQMGLIREELDQMQRLTRELNELKDELKRREAQGSSPAKSPTVNQPRPNPAPATGQTQPTPSVVMPQPIPPPKAESGGPPGDSSIHNWLSDRIAALDKERQGRWQKLMSFLTGN